MMRAFEGLVFLSLAASLHLGVWAAAPQLSGARAPGGMGDGALRLSGATPQMAKLSRHWEDPPELIAAHPPAPAPMQVAKPLPRTGSAKMRPETRPLAAVPLPLVPRSESVPRTPPPAQAPATPVPRTPTLPVYERTPTRQAAHVPASDPAPAAPDRARLDRPPQADLPASAPTARLRPKARPDDLRHPAPAPRRASTARPASGGEAAASTRATSRPDKTAAANAATRNALQAEWGARIQGKVHRRLIYPRGASGSGTARVSLTVNRSGTLTALRLLRTSGNTAFDKAALSAVRRAGRFPPAPHQLTDAHYHFALSLTFRP